MIPQHGKLFVNSLFLRFLQYSTGVGVGDCSHKGQQSNAVAVSEFTCTVVSDQCFALRKFICSWPEELQDQQMNKSFETAKA